MWTKPKPKEAQTITTNMNCALRVCTCKPLLYKFNPYTCNTKVYKNEDSCLFFIIFLKEKSRWFSTTSTIFSILQASSIFCCGVACMIFFLLLLYVKKKEKGRFSLHMHICEQIIHEIHWMHKIQYNTFSRRFTIATKVIETK